MFRFLIFQLFFQGAADPICLYVRTPKQLPSINATKTTALKLTYSTKLVTGIFLN